MSIAALLAAMLGYGGYWIWQNVRVVEEKIDLGYSEEARKNPYLAAQHYLSETGVDALNYTGVGELQQLPNTDSTLIVFSSRMILSQKKLQELLDWMQAGGHLITTAQSLYDEQNQRSGDMLMDEFGVEKYYSADLQMNQPEDAEASDPTSESPEADASSSEPPSSEPPSEQAESMEEFSKRLEKLLGEEQDDEDLFTYLYFGVPDDPVVVKFDTTYHLYDSSETASSAAGSAYGTHLLQYDHGQGLLTVITDPTVWRNSRVDEYDHAYFLSLLVGHSRDVHFVYDVSIDAWPKLIWQNHPQLVISMAVLIVLLLWYGSRRFGPLAPPMQHPRRSLEEHIHATADFFWQQHQPQVLIDGLRDVVYERASRHRPGIRQASEADQKQWLHELTQVPEADIEQALFQPAPDKESELLHTTRIIKALRDAL